MRHLVISASIIRHYGSILEVIHVSFRVRRGTNASNVCDFNAMRANPVSVDKGRVGLRAVVLHRVVKAFWVGTLRVAEAASLVCCMGSQEGPGWLSTLKGIRCLSFCILDTSLCHRMKSSSSHFHQAQNIQFHGSNIVTLN